MRFVKKLIYGIFYLGILGAIGYGLYVSNVFTSPTCFDNRQNQGEERIDCGGPNCVPCAIKSLQPIRGSAKIFPLDTNANLVLTFVNPNIEYGASSFNYTLNFYDANRQKIFSLARSSYIYAAQAEKVVVEPNLPVNYGQLSGAPELTIESPAWKKEAEFPSPKFQLRQVVTVVSGKQATITGVFANRESSGLAEAAIGVLVSRKSSGLPVGASKTTLQNIRPFEEVTFKIVVPLSASFKLAEIEPALFAEAKR